MLRIVLLTCGAAIALYLVWNFLQLFFGIFRERRGEEKKKLPPN